MIVRMRRFAEIGPLAARLVAVSLVLAGCASGPKGSSGPVLLEMAGRKVTLEDLRLQYERANGPGTFAMASPDQKGEFLKTIGDKEVLLAAAREKTGGLTPAEEKALRASDDQKLLKGLEFEVLAPIRADSATSQRMLTMFKRQILCDWLVTSSDSLTRVARSEIASGRPFAEVARRYSKADPTKVPDGHLEWTSGMQFGRDYGKELFLEERAPGYLSEVRQTPRGYELFQVKGYRPYDLRGAHEASFFPAFVQDIRSHDRLVAWSDSLEKAHGLDVRDDAVATLRAGMAPYWDSLKVQVQMTRQRVSTFTPPLSHFDADQRRTPLYEFDGKATTIAEFLDGLRDVNPTMWPNDPDPSGFRKQVESLALMRLELNVARQRGIDRLPDYLLECRLDREKLLLTKLQEAVTKDQPPLTAEDVKVYYDSHLDTYRTKDRMLLSYFIFKTLPEAQRFFSEAMKNDSGWWAEKCGEYVGEHPEVTVVSNSPEIDANNPPPEVAPIVARARNLKVNDIVEPIQTVTGWAVSRVAFNEHAGIQPIEKVDGAIRRTMSDARTEEAMQKVIDEGRTRYKLKLYPERLIPKT